MDFNTSSVATIKISNSKGEVAFVLREGDLLSVGRDEGNDVCLLDEMVSRWHLTFSASAQGIALNDLQSTNGTFVNGRRISGSVTLKDRDLVDVGATKITVMFSGRASAAAPPAAPDIKRSATAQFKPLQVSVLVVSICDYERLATQFPAELLTRLHLQWNNEVMSVAQALGGKVEKISGADVICYWFDEAGIVAARNACSAVVRLRKLLAELLQSPSFRHDDQPLPWRATMVVASGMGLKASGASETDGVTVLGNPSEVAFQLADLVGKLGVDVVLCENTAQIIEDTMAVKPLIRIRLKKNEQPAPVFTLQEEPAAPAP